MTGIKKRPILFSAPMVRATLEGRKTMTRRTRGLDKINDDPDAWELAANKGGGKWMFRRTDSCTFATATCPYGSPGGRLWVRETHYAYGRWVKNGFTQKGNQKRSFSRVGEMPIRFEEPPDGFRTSRDMAQPGKEQWYKRLGRFMPKAYARIWLEVTGVRVDRLQDITEQDAVAEGVKPVIREKYFTVVCRGGQTFEVSSLYERGVPAVGEYVSPFGEVTHVEPIPERIIRTAREAFRTLWVKINGRESWDANPWVWVVEFRMVTGEGKVLEG